MGSPRPILTADLQGHTDRRKAEQSDDRSQSLYANTDRRPQIRYKSEAHVYLLHYYAREIYMSPYYGAALQEKRLQQTIGKVISTQHHSISEMALEGYITGLESHEGFHEAGYLHSGAQTTARVEWSTSRESKRFAVVKTSHNPDGTLRSYTIKDVGKEEHDFTHWKFERGKVTSNEQCLQGISQLL